MVERSPFCCRTPFVAENKKTKDPPTTPVDLLSSSSSAIFHNSDMTRFPVQVSHSEHLQIGARYERRQAVQSPQPVNLTFLRFE